MMICNFRDCENNSSALGLCDSHYRQWILFSRHTPINVRDFINRQEDDGTEDTPAYRECDIFGCKEKHQTNGLCKPHYIDYRNNKELVGIAEYINLKPVVNTGERLRHCSVLTCTRKSRVDCLCWGHYIDWRDNHSSTMDISNYILQDIKLRNRNYTRKGECTLKGCDNAEYHIGTHLCFNHYRQYRSSRVDDTLEAFMERKNLENNLITCMHINCEKEHVRKGLCKKHYAQYMHLNRKNPLDLEKYKKGFRPTTYRKSTKCGGHRCKEETLSLGLCVHHFSDYTEHYYGRISIKEYCILTRDEPAIQTTK